MARVILHVDMDAFYASIEQRDRPELRGKPVIVGSPPTQRGVVAAASYEARRFGVHSAMPSRTAGKLCPQGVFVPPDMRRYVRVSRQIFAILERFTPLLEPLSLDEAFLDVTGAQRLFGDGPAIARKIKDAIRSETGLTASAGVAPNKFLAKIASDLHKPDGLTVVPNDLTGIQAFLAPLPVGRLWGVGPVLRTRLEAGGLATIGDLQQRSLEDLARLIGQNQAEYLKALAEGRDDRPVEPEREEKSVSREHTFLHDVKDRDELEQVLAGLVDDVGRSLRRLGKLANGVQIKLRWQGFETITRQKKLPAPAADNFGLLAAAQELFVREKLIKPVRLIGFGVHGLIAAAARPRDLFEDPALGKRERVSQAVDAIREQFGSHSIRHGGSQARGRPRG